MAEHKSEPRPLQSFAGFVFVVVLAVVNDSGIFVLNCTLSVPELVHNRFGRN